MVYLRNSILRYTRYFKAFLLKLENSFPFNLFGRLRVIRNRAISIDALLYLPSRISLLLLELLLELELVNSTKSTIIGRICRHSSSAALYLLMSVLPDSSPSSKLYLLERLSIVEFFLLGTCRISKSNSRIYTSYLVTSVLSRLLTPLFNHVTSTFISVLRIK